MDQVLVIAVDISDFQNLEETTERWKILNFNITNQQGTSLNPTPIRPSVAAGAASGAPLGGGAVQRQHSLGHKVYFLTWPNQLPGDAIPTVSVNLIYTPVAQALPWVKTTFYPAGSIVISSEASIPGGSATTNGHYYVARYSGISGATEPNFVSNANALPTFVDGPGIGWQDMGIRMPAPTPVQWRAASHYDAGQFVVPFPANGKYYQAKYSGVSGATQPTFTGTNIADGVADGLTWINSGPTPYKTSPDPWTKNTTYQVGAQIVPPNGGNGHFYQQVGVVGSSSAPPPTFTLGATATINDGPNVKWKDMGPISLPTWQAGTAYAQGARIVPNPGNGSSYEAMTTGVSGLNPPPFPSVLGGRVIETPGLQWLDAGTTAPASSRLRRWSPETVFFSGDAVLDDQTGHYYSVTQAGVSGFTRPSFAVPAPVTVGASDVNIEWQDLGTVLPSSLSVGMPVTDQSVNLLSNTYAQAHALSRFNLTSGVVFSSARPPNLVNTGTTMAPIYTKYPGSPLIDPVLAVSAYIFRPVDAERKFQYKDLIPAPTVGFSLTSPSNNFYFGASSEFFLRNLQITYGVSSLKLTELGPLTTGTTTSTSTIQQTSYHGFVGLTFNITGFIQTLF
jgi:hypothetical protein